MKDKIGMFLLGTVFGVVVFYAILVSTGATPRDEYKKFTGKAVQMGYGRWVIDTNNFPDASWTPIIKFEWVTNRTASVN